MKNSQPDDATLSRIDDLAAQLYDEADPTAPEASPEESLEQICPMFDALRKLTERYREAELIGRGAMKEVYRVYDARAGRHVALARLRAELSQDYFDAFLREAHLTARLQHSSIIRLFDMGIDRESRPFFTMEFKRGRSLREVLRSLAEDKARERYPLRRRVVIFARICEAVAYAHSRRVLHLDLKPENVQVGDFGEVQVCDWGLGVLIPGEADETDMEALLDLDLYGSLHDSVTGTPVYMAPEQNDRLQPKTPQMDIYALGCILMELATLRSPAGSDHDCPNLEPALRAMISRATHPDPRKRYRSVAAFGEDVGLYLSGYSTKAEPRSFLRELGLFYCRNRTPCLVSLSLGSLLLVSAALFTMEVNERRREAEDAMRRYVQKREQSEERLKVQSHEVQAQVTEMAHSAFPEGVITKHVVAGMMRHIDKVLSLDPPRDSGAWIQKFWLCFMIQDFQTAVEVSSPEMLDVCDLFPLAEKYALRRGDEPHLGAEDLAELLGEIVRLPRGRRALIERMMLYDASLSRPYADRIAIVEAVLRAANPRWEGHAIQADEEAKRISLQGAALEHLVFQGPIVGAGRCLLRTLNPLALDLRTTGISDLAELEGLELIELDIRDTPVNSLLPLGNMRSLRRVLVEPGRFSPQMIARLPQDLQVIESVREL